MVRHGSPWFAMVRQELTNRELTNRELREGMSLKEAIKHWKITKNEPGSNQYSRR